MQGDAPGASIHPPPPSLCSSISRQHLADYIATNYTAPRMVISAAGAVDHGALVAAAEKAFAKLPSAGKSAGDLVKEASGAGFVVTKRLVCKGQVVEG